MPKKKRTKSTNLQKKKEKTAQKLSILTNVFITNEAEKI